LNFDISQLESLLPKILGYGENILAAIVIFVSSFSFSFSSGVLLLLFRSFKVGDVVDAGGAGGRVESLQLFTTVLALPDGSKIIVPNG
jgi:small-conductance mechanosensitive channel